MSTDLNAASSPEWSMLSLANQDPFPTYDVLRERGRVVWDPGMKCWLVLSYDVCKVIESDEATYRIMYADASPLTLKIKGGNIGLSALTGDKHVRMRRIYLRLLSPQLMPKYRDEHVLPVINDAIDRFAPTGHAELVSQFAEPIPERVMASVFGLPWKDDELIDNISRWHKDVTAWIGMKNSGDEFTRKAQLACDELNNLLRPIVIERREQRGSDLVSSLWNLLPEHYGDVDVDDVLAVTRDIAIGAGETTTNAIANVAYLLLTDPAVCEAVSKDHHATLNSFVEESLRLLGSVQWRYRIANKDVEIDGKQIKKDDTILLLHAAANRDPEHFGCPHMMDLNRTPPTDHVAFNVGPRVCAGMHLARLELRECAKALLTRLPNMRLDDTKEKPYFRHFSHRSYGPLHVTF
ncbi:cytochrome P450 [Burkholderia cepacia]|uniref:cytochrome P450 n=1 Tax=Burkholderia cepacia TaxID=292 RepID=UPI002AB5FECC|nr:cytochrome P450 [Burkholderia cepacia]